MTTALLPITMLMGHVVYGPMARTKQDIAHVLSVMREAMATLEARYVELRDNGPAADEVLTDWLMTELNPAAPPAPKKKRGRKAAAPADPDTPRRPHRKRANGQAPAEPPADAPLFQPSEIQPEG